ncbi:MAG TPA: hypothetical protein VI759_10965 [Dehalococcoidia bacterium]|nr:hypothetical protein [Dehalococcoidia bacterium]
MTYIVVLADKAGGGYEAVCPAFDCAAEGASVHEAIAAIKREIDRVLSAMRAGGQAAPSDDGYRIALEYEDRLRALAANGQPLSLATHEVEVGV